jgi:hypothetical protein
MAEARTRAALLLAQDGQRDGRAIVPRVYARAERTGTARPASRTRTMTTCARPACWACACRASHGGLGADFATYVMVAAELGRFCGATALSYNMHICSHCMWTGFIADALDMTRRAARRPRAPTAADPLRAASSKTARSTQPFSEGGAAAAGKAPWGTHAAQGGRRLSRQRAQDLRVAGRRGRLLRRAVHRWTRATDKRRRTRDTLYLAVPADARASAWSATGTRWACAARSAARSLRGRVRPDEAR